MREEALVLEREVHAGVAPATLLAGERAARDEATVVPVFKNATALTFRYLDPQGEWRTAWGLPGSGQKVLPAAVEMTLQLASGEKIVRLVDLPRSQ